MPFYGKTIKDIFRANAKGVASFRGRTWRRISPQAREFVQQLMTIDPQCRPSAQQALEHEWLAGDDLSQSRARGIGHFTRDQYRDSYTSPHVTPSCPMCYRTCTELSGDVSGCLSMCTMTGVEASTSPDRPLPSFCDRTYTVVSTLGSTCASSYCRTLTDGVSQFLIRTCSENLPSIKSSSALPCMRTYSADCKRTNFGLSSPITSAISPYKA